MGYSKHEFVYIPTAAELRVTSYVPV